jgi:endonuclease I
VPLKAAASGPDEFYAPLLNRLSGAFREELHELIDDRVSISYDDTVDTLRWADRVALTPSLVLDLYSANTFLAVPPEGERRSWDREHVWPDSHGYDGDIESGRCNVPLTDAHMLFVADRIINQNHHGDRFYDDGPDCPPIGGLGGDLNRRCVESFEVWRQRRGDVARAMFYADVRYDGGSNQARVPGTFRGPRDRDGHCLEPDLVLTNTISAITPTLTTTGTAHMGVLQTLLRWHFEDPVDARDRQHNEAVDVEQTNRNPFIDHPDWVCRVWPEELPCHVRRFAFLPILQRSN